MVVKAQYLSYLQEDTNGYWNQHPQHHVITVTTYRIFDTRLEVNAFTNFHTITKSVGNRTQAKNDPYQDSLYILLTLTTITSDKKLVIDKY